MNETVKCGLCNGFTSDVVYRGRLQCCGVRVFFGRCCKEKAVMLFDTLGAAGVAFGKLHTFICNAKNDVIVDETEVARSSPLAKPVINAETFQFIRMQAEAAGHVIDGSWVLVVPRIDKKDVIAKLFGVKFEFGNLPDPLPVCRVPGDLLGVFEGVPVVARWDTRGGAMLCRQEVLANKSEGSPPN